MKRNKNRALSVLIGFEETSAFGKKVAFSDDASISETMLMLEETEKEREEEFRNIKKCNECAYGKPKARCCRRTDRASGLNVASLRHEFQTNY